MKNRVTIFIGAIVFAAAFAVASVSAQSVSGSIANGTVKRGVAARATVLLSIPGGLHVNSNRPGNEYQIATTVRATSANAKIGSVTYPRGKNRTFAFSETAINVYDGRTSFTFPVTVPATFKGNSISVRVVVKYQACNEEVCYPPKSKEVTLTARVN